MTYRFVDTHITSGAGSCIRRAGSSAVGQLIDTPSLCGRVHVGSRYTRDDGPVPGETYAREMIETPSGPFPRWCQDCLRIWQHETGQTAANDNSAELREKAMDDLREERRRAMRDLERYERRVTELDARLEAIRHITRGDWCAAQGFVNDYCEQRKAAGK